MPIKVCNGLPAKTILENENIFVMDEKRAVAQDIRPLSILIFNIMPLKEETEVQLLRCLSNTSLQIDVTFLTTESYIGKNTSQSHLNKFYEVFADVKDKKYDGLIVTGAPVEQMEFEEVAYWEEFKHIMDWTEKNVTSTLYICWGAQAGLYYKYGIKKYALDKKVSGIYKHRTHLRKELIARGFDDIFYVPHSRYTSVHASDIERNKELKLIASSDKAGPYLIVGRDRKDVFVTGHAEYDRITLDKEYRRDLEKGLKPDMPYNYYPEDNPEKKPELVWRAHSNALFSNWLNYYVYQETPYDWK